MIPSPPTLQANHLSPSPADVAKKADTMLAQLGAAGLDNSGAENSSGGGASKGTMSYDDLAATAKRFPNLVFPSYVLEGASGGASVIGASPIAAGGRPSLAMHMPGAGGGPVSVIANPLSPLARTQKAAAAAAAADEQADALPGMA